MFGYFIMYDSCPWALTELISPPKFHGTSKMNEICAKYTGAGAREIGESDRAPP